MVSEIQAIECGASARAADAPSLSWHGSPVQWAEWRIALGEQQVSSRIVVVRFDPRVVQLSLDLVNKGTAMGAWSLAQAPIDALVALNAGQFTDAGPWGWVVHRGREWQAPGVGTLAGALVIDGAGAARVVDATEIAGMRANGVAIEAVQSYPTLIGANHAAPSHVCDAQTPDAVLDRTHRDTRLAIGTLADGRVIVAMSRYSGAGAMAERLPIGPTTPEMAEVMRRLGATRALMLDGGLSAQLLVRGDRAAKATQWPGLRSVPLALVGKVRQPDR